MDLLKSYLLTFLFFTLNGVLLKIAFSVYNYADYFESRLLDVIYAVLWGARFDMALAAIVSLILIFLWQGSSFLGDHGKKIFGFFFLLIFWLVSSMQFSDIMYYVDSGRHMSYEVTDAGVDTFSLIATAATQHSLLYLFSFLYIFLGALVAVKYVLPLFAQINSTLPSRVTQYFVSILLSLFCFRGGLQIIPLEPLHANQIGDSELAVIAMNGTYNIIYESVKGSRRVEPILLPALKTPANVANLYSDVTKRESFKPLVQRNIVIVFLEGWPARLMASYGFDRVSTPFFDSLRERSITSTGMIAGGNRTTEGLFATLCSYPNPLGRSVAQTQL
ncbi:hypothetical protein OAQ84_02000, partial [Bdellovibrionales bacterium]|nr:hypothetical protein [Bdellovibrionales bacterium]